MNRRWIKTIVLFLVFAAGIGIRLYDLTDPPLDFHLARQLRSAVIARSVYYQLNTNLDPVLRQQAVNLAALEVYEPPILENIVGFTYFLMGAEYLWVSGFIWLCSGESGVGLFICWERGTHPPGLFFWDLLSISFSLRARLPAGLFYPIRGW